MIMKTLLITIVLLTICSVHGQTDEKETLRQLSQNAISSYQNQKFDDAIKFAQQAVDLSLKIYGAKNVETAVAYTNLGVIYRDKKKFKESIENLQKAVNVYESVPNLKSREQVTTYEALARSQSLDGLKKEAETNYLKAIETAESNFGKESKESLSPALNLANFYACDKKFEKANDFYLRSYALAIKHYGKSGKEVEQVEDSRVCYVSTQGLKYQKTETFPSFYEEKKKLFGETPENGGILNAKAKILPQPRYPEEAKSQGIGGTTPLRVKVDEQGNVFEVRTLCGNPILARATEEAVKNAKFETVLVNGKPIKYSGIVIYNYVPAR